jgi:hypothetical protein
MTTDNERERAQLERIAEGPQDGHPILVVVDAVGEVDWARGFAFRRMRAPTPETIAAAGYITILEALDLVIDAHGCGYVVGQKPYGEQFPGAADEAWAAYQAIGRKLGAHVTDFEVGPARTPCSVCGARLQPLDPDGRCKGCRLYDQAAAP